MAVSAKTPDHWPENFHGVSAHLPFLTQLKLTTLVLVIVALAQDTAETEATEDLPCLSASYSEARSLVRLPKDVRTLLNLDAQEEVSDRTGPFNIGDVGGGPFHRFSLAAVNSRRILVAVEYGGFASGFELWSFEYRRYGWQGRKIPDQGAGLPDSLQELISQVCASSASR